MTGERSGTRVRPVFAVVAVAAVAAVVVLLLVGRSTDPGAEARGAGRTVDSVAIWDSLEAQAERSIVRSTMSLTAVAGRSGVPVDSLVAELGLPESASRTDPLRVLMPLHGFTERDVAAARDRLRQRLPRQ